MIAAALQHALAAHGIELRKARDGENRAACPWCDKGPRDDALAVRIEGDCAVYKCHRCGRSGRVSELGAIPKENRTPQIRPKPENRGAREIAARIWAECLPLAATAGSEYLRMRACILPPIDGDLRFHPGLFCSEITAKAPAIVARVSTAVGNEFVGVHRIFLNGTDRAIAKLRLGGGSGAPVCVRLWPDDAVERFLAIAEGIETALAAAHIRTPIWAAIDAGQLQQFPVLPGVESLGIFADNDPVGLRAARDCMARWRAAGREVIAVAPSRAGDDFNNVIREAQHA